MPPAAMDEVLRAFGTVIDLERDVRNGDRFHVRHEHTFAADGQSIGVGRVLWAELKLATKGTIAVHRFRPLDGPGRGVERLWFANGQDASPSRSAIRLPIESAVVSSAFGMRADPFDQPSAAQARAVGPLHTIRPPAMSAGGAGRVNVATPLGISMGLSPEGAPSWASTSGTPRVGRAMVMHEGVDFVAPPGTPVFAAADGVVTGAAPNGGYGNWVRIDHDGGKLETVYGHLETFAPSIKPGARVTKGEVVGFVGNTGRSTGPHLHFELLVGGKPVNPMTFTVAKAAPLQGSDLARLRAQVARTLKERAPGY